MSMKINKVRLNTMLLSSLLIFLVVIFPEHKEYAAILVLLFSIIFGINYKTCMPYYFAMMVLVYTNFGSLVNSISTGNFPIKFEMGIIMGGGGVIFLQSYKKYRREMFSTVIMLSAMAISILVASAKYGQPLGSGLFAFISKWFPFLMIFPLSEYLRKQNRVFFCIQYCADISLVVCMLLCLQYFVLGDRYPFLELALKNRYSGEPGYLIHSVSPMLCMSLGCILMTQEKKWGDWFKAGMIIVTIIVVSKTRVFMAAIVGVVMYCLLLYSRKISITSKLGVALLSSIILVPLMPSIFEWLGNTFFLEIIKKGDNYIRIREILWFNSQNLKPKIWGMGIENRSYIHSPFLVGVSNYRYYVSDLGIIGMFFQYGIQGVAAIAVYVAAMKRKLCAGAGYYFEGLYNCLVVLIVVTCVSVSPTQYMIPIVVIFSTVSASQKRIKNDNKEGTRI